MEKLRARDPVRPGEEHADGERRAAGRRGRVRTDVLHVVDARRRGYVPSSSNAIADRAVLVAGLARRHEVLAPVLDPLDRRRHLAGGQHDGTCPRAGARPSGRSRRRCRAMITRIAVLGDAEHAGANAAHLVRGLRRGPDRQLVARAPTTPPRAHGSPSAPRRRPAGRSSRSTTWAADAEHLVDRPRRAAADLRRGCPR